MKYLCDGQWLSDEEFAEWIADLSIYDLAEMSCESKAYTMQMLEASETLEDKAQMLGIEMRIA